MKDLNLESIKLIYSIFFVINKKNYNFATFLFLKSFE